MEKESLERLELLIKQFDKANSIFNEAIAVTTTEEKRKELLEQAFLAYTDIITLLPAKTAGMLLLKRAVLEKIHAVEAMIEQEIEKSVSSSNNSNSSSSSNSSKIIEEALAEARLSLLAID